jgi:hypothetical protein
VWVTRFVAISDLHLEFAVFGKSTRIAPSTSSTVRDQINAIKRSCQTLHHDFQSQVTFDFDFPTLSLHRVNYHTLYTHSRLHPTSDGGNRNAMPTRFRCVRLACTICHVRDDRRFVGLSLATILLGYEALVAWRLASDYACARHLNRERAWRRAPEHAWQTPGALRPNCAMALRPDGMGQARFLSIGATSPDYLGLVSAQSPDYLGLVSAQSPDYLGLVSAQSPDYLGLVSAQASLQVGHGERACGELLDG